MKAIMDFPPRFCPNCGNPLGPWIGDSRQDLLAYCSHRCKCGMQFQLATTQTMLEAATKSFGDMAQYA